MSAFVSLRREQSFILSEIIPALTLCRERT
jgi:hypothetical protein